jgi:hypothetical protein
MQTDYCSSGAERRWPITEQMVVLNVPEPTIYEQLYRQLYTYHFGAIGFLELLNRFEQILHIHSPPDNQDMVDTAGSCPSNKLN